MTTVVLHGATGYTGRLTAAAMLRTGLRPVLSGRSRERLEAVAEQVAPGADLRLHATDSRGPEAIAEALEPGDVLVSTVGPFLERGQPALDAAVAAGAHYVDISGEPDFLRRVFDEAGPAAEGRCALLPSFGFDYVPGTLAAALALRQAGAQATAVHIGYFATGHTLPTALSNGTIASLQQILALPSFRWRDGRVVDDRAAVRTRTFSVHGTTRRGRNVGAAEHLTLPRLYPQLEEVEVFLGWSGRLGQPLQLAAGALAVASRVPLVRRVATAVPRAFAWRSGHGPDQETRARTGSFVAAEAMTADGEVLASVRFAGGNMYEVTASLLAFAARTLAAGEVRSTGALGPVEAMGMDALVIGCAEAGLTQV